MRTGLLTKFLVAALRAERDRIGGAKRGVSRRPEKAAAIALITFKKEKALIATPAGG